MTGGTASHSPIRLNSLHEPTTRRRAALPEIGIKIPLADIYSGAGLTGKSTDGKAY
jgi:hypothetical protein